MRECHDKFFDIYRYRNNVTRPGMVYHRDARKLLALNYVEIDGLIRYVCEKMGGEEHIDEFRQYYFEKYLKGVGNYRPSLGPMAKFFYRSVYFKYGHYLKDISYMREIPSGLEVGECTCSFEGEHDAREEYGVLRGKLQRKGEELLVRVMDMMRDGYKPENIMSKLNLTVSRWVRLLGGIRELYQKGAIYA